MASYDAPSPSGQGHYIAPSNARVPVVYQIDFTAVAAGKRIASTKRRVRWRFGFANPEALAAGETGIACRGEEHDITLVWSVTSGKLLILADGHEVHGATSRGGLIDFTWTMKGNHVLKIYAHASPPLSLTPGWRQYDFFVDGQSFFNFPKVFRLGLAASGPQGDPRPQPTQAPRSLTQYEGQSRSYTNYSIPPLRRSSSSNIGNMEAPRTPAEEDAYLQEAIMNSMQEIKKPAPSTPVAPQSNQQGPDLLIDFFNDSSAPLALPPSNYGTSTLSAPYPPVAYPSQNAGPSPLALLPTTNESYQYPGQPATPNYGAPSYSVQLAQLSSPPVPPAGYAAPGFTSPPDHGTPSSLGFMSPGGVGFQQYGNTPYDLSQQFAAPSAPTHAVPGPSYGGPAPSPYGAPDPSHQFGAPPASPFLPAPPQTAPYGDPATNPSSQYSAPSAEQHAHPTQHDPYEQSSAPHEQNSQFAEPQTTEQNSFAAAEAEVAVPLAAESEPPVFTMYSLSIDQSNPFSVAPDPAPNTSMAEKAFSKFANMDTFQLVSKNDVKRANPFESAPIGSSLPLGVLKKATTPRTDIMRTPGAAPPPAPAPAVAPGALVVNSQQAGNWGLGYGAPVSQPASQEHQGSYGGQSMYGQQPQPHQQPPSGQPAYGQQPQPHQQPPYGQPAYGQQPQPHQQPPYGQPAYGQQGQGQQQQQQPVFGQSGQGQQPHMQQQFAYGQPAYGQPPQAYQQPPYGQSGQGQQPHMQQQFAYGQPPQTYG